MSVLWGLLIRRRAPAGGCFSDSDRVSGLFGVPATGFAMPHSAATA